MPLSCMAVTVQRSTSSGTLPTVNLCHATYAVGKYPTHTFIISSAQSAHRGTASRAIPRRRHRDPRQPRIRTVAANPPSAVQIHSPTGAGSPAMPSEVMYQYNPAAHATPTASAHGNRLTLHCRDRRPIAQHSATNASSWIRNGSHPCVSDAWVTNEGTPILRETVPS
ncbi:Uncharacterised protein [Mycobacteroides abscessus subsp. abscessus]|nr:Uncharacterised protein [Mycobacteroides abscessus subsp. abscessus]